MTRLRPGLFLLQRSGVNRQLSFFTVRDKYQLDICWTELKAQFDRAKRAKPDGEAVV
jgi:hypothetical protein